MTIFFQAMAFICFPAIFLWAEKRVKIIALLGTVIICYGMGLLIGNLPFIPLDTDFSKTMTEASVPLAIPLLLFNVDLKAWFHLAPKTLLAFLCSIISVSFATIVSGIIFQGKLPELWKVAGMLTGVFVGGTPNMSAIGMALDVKQEIFVLLSASDLIVCGVYFFIILSVGQKALLLFLPRYNSKQNVGIYNSSDSKSLSLGGKILDGTYSILLAAVIMAISIGLSYLLFKQISVPFFLMVLTTLAVLASFYPPIRTLKTSYLLGQYILFIFCISIGSMASISMIAHAGINFILFTLTVLIISILLNFFLAFIAKIDADTALITHIAAIYGPAFIGPVADSMKNKDIVVSGITTGLVGYAVGNYVGLAVSYFLRMYF
ncbi:MAG: DUF819 family protein [Bdellovibrio sp.]|nr:DUF819 family protein [Bdellovibrio sp.]